MDNIKIITIIFMNLVIIFILSLIISTCVRNYRKKEYRIRKKFIDFKRNIFRFRCYFIADLCCSFLLFYISSYTGYPLSDGTEI